MKNLLPILFASIAAVGNAMFALGQKKSAGAENGLLFVAVSALVAVLCAFAFAPLSGPLEVEKMMGEHWKAVAFSGTGLFLTYLGFNLLYTQYGASQYVLYAVLSIITTTIVVGILWLKEPVNLYHLVAIAMAIAAVVFFSIGQSKT